jgi:hypothetical protein
MCHVYINAYVNRTSNHLLSIINLFFYAQILPNEKNEKNKTFSIKPHPLFKIKDTLPSKNIHICPCEKKINLTNKLFSDKKINLHKMKEIYEQFIYAPNLEIFSNEDVPIADIAIHIRSGDIFKNNIHPFYAQPCLDFYIKLCKSNLNIVIVYENEINPVIPLLKIYCKNKNLTNIKFYSNHVHKDIYILSRSKKLVFSNATFCVIPFVISKTIKQVLIPQSVDRQGFKVTGNDIYPINFKNYIYNWKNTTEQLKQMQEYKLTDDAENVILKFIES